MRDKSLSVRRHFYREIAAIALHLQDDPPEQGLAGLDNPILPAQEDVYAPQTNATDSATARSGLVVLC